MQAQRVIAIGSSTGGVKALRTLIAALPQDIPAAILVVQHVHAAGPGLLPSILTQAGRLPAGHAEDGQPVEAGRIHVAPPDRHMLIAGEGCLQVSMGPRENGSRPAIDPLFRSVALAYGPRAVGVILTGMLDDGAAGLRAIKLCGGTTVVQDPAEAVAPSMPRSALRASRADHCVGIAELGPLLDQLARVPIPEQNIMDATARRELEIEAAIGAGDRASLDGARLFGEPSLFTCPECHGVLSRMRGDTTLRFRCHTGHAFTAESLLNAVRQESEAALWGAIRSLQEQAMLLEHLAQHATSAEESHATETWRRAADEMRAKANQVRDALGLSAACR